MPDATPPVIVIAPEVPPDFRLENPRPPDPFRIRQDCGSPGTEIVICGRRKDDRYRLGPPWPDAPTLMGEVADGLNLGPLRIRPAEVQGAKSSGPGVSFKIEF